MEVGTFPVVSFVQVLWVQSQMALHLFCGGHSLRRALDYLATSVRTLIVEGESPNNEADQTQADQEPKIEVDRDVHNIHALSPCALGIQINETTAPIAYGCLIQNFSSSEVGIYFPGYDHLITGQSCKAPWLDRKLAFPIACLHRDFLATLQFLVESHMLLGSSLLLPVVGKTRTSPP